MRFPRKPFVALLGQMPDMPRDEMQIRSGHGWFFTCRFVVVKKSNKAISSRDNWKLNMKMKKEIINVYSFQKV
jgi:hypothetical protein